MEESVRQTERLRTELGFIETTATAAGEAMTDLVTESLFGEGPEAAARRFTEALAEMAVQAAFTQLAVMALNAAMAGGPGAPGGTGAGIGTTVTTGAGAGGRQHGGPVRAGSSYIVGESGRELFVPRTSGTIVPNSALGRRRRRQPGDQSTTSAAAARRRSSRTPTPAA